MDNFDKRYAYGACNVEDNYYWYFSWLTGKLHDIFKWEGLPDNVDETFLNNQLFLTGSVCWTEFEDKLYPVMGNLGGVENEYYMPTVYTISNPVLGSKSVNVYGPAANGIMMYNSPKDKIYTYLPAGGGLYRLIKLTATLLADNISSINTAQINSRVNTIITADSTSLKNSAEEYLKRLYSGKPYSVLDEKLLNSIKVNPVSNPALANVIAQLIELHQYILAQFYNSVGIKTNPVNKKERLITGEIDSVDDYLAVTLDEMLDCRVSACNAINEKFGTDITCKINPILQPVLEGDEDNGKEVLDRDGSDINETSTTQLGE